MKRSEKIRIGVSLLILAVSVTIVIVPLYLVVLNSFKPYSEIAKNISALPKEITLINYQQAWKRLNFSTVFKNTMIIAVFWNDGILDREASMQIHKGMVSDHHSGHVGAVSGDYDYVCEDGGIFEAHQPSLRRGDQQLGLLHAYEHVSDCRGGEISPV